MGSFVMPICRLSELKQVLCVMPLTFSSSNDVNALPSRDPGLDVFSAVGTWDDNVCVEQTGRAVLASELFPSQVTP